MYCDFTLSKLKLFVNMNSELQPALVVFVNLYDLYISVENRFVGSQQDMVGKFF